jgi:membrane protease YdiL (CAAX protease family)
MKKIFPNNIFQLLIIFLLLITCAVIAYQIDSHFLKKTLPDFKIAFEYIFTFGFPILIILYFNYKYRNYFPSLSSNKMGVLYYAIPLVILSSIGFLKIINNFLFPPHHFVNLYTNWGIMMPLLIGPILEEFFFRGIIQRGLETRYSTVFSIVTSSLLFMLIHNPNQYISALFLGLLFGYIYYKTNNLFILIILHIIANNVSTVFNYLQYLNPDTKFLTYSTYLSFILFLFTIYFYIKKHGISNSQNI